MKILLSLLFAPVVVFLTNTEVLAAIRTKNIEYKQGSTVLEGYLAYDDAIKGKRPGVLVVHEWNGLQSYAKKRTEQLAKLGYVAFAADIYGKGVRPKNSQESGAQAKIYRDNRKLLRDRVNAGLQVLQKNPLTDPKRIAAIGYCFGGGTVLELARSGANIAGVVSFHGNLDTPNPEDAKNIKAKVLVLHGADDPFVPQEQLQGFENEMRQANVDWQLISYGGVVHAFTNPVYKGEIKGALYNKNADQRSWQAMRQFFAEIFR
ncbi:dienelactone hydrolase family protein [Sphaerospermopsis aphanizomenoides BCCUSP55]|uniref:dienelactone hydrolase family protein n=1 Tax=Sphaerospermopsis aphanizomenoides TaxID=459663 RepID=UPI001902CABC|nr:dienelactone hydrolase family protein [Sphaerospermopsis aphanizomenoides]MBK1987348.1 dienelactone hydrolase family protein [Sphaerospermopsis aphanizomenoides BCCUSP55]